MEIDCRVRAAVIEYAPSFNCSGLGKGIFNCKANRCGFKDADSHSVLHCYTIKYGNTLDLIDHIDDMSRSYNTAVIT